MKKSSNGVVKTILRVILVVALPTVFIGILFFALNQSFGIGLIIISSLLIIQLLLSRKSEKSFSWSEYENFSFWGMQDEDKFYKKLNILFNVAKVTTVLGILRLIHLNFSEILNPFGSLGMSILACLTLIGILSICLGGYNKRGNYLGSYEVARVSFAVAVLLTIVSFVYMTFLSQLIWIPFFATTIFAFLRGYDEIGQRFNMDEGEFEFYLIIATLLASIVSTVIQFWSYIASFFVSIWSFLVKVGMYELIPGGHIWKVFLVIIVLAVIIVFVKYLRNRNRTKKESLRIYNENKEILAKEKLAKEEELKAKKIKEEEEKQKEKLFVEKTWKEIAALEEVLEKREITMKELLYISSVYSRFECISRFKVKHLTAIPLKDFFVISLVKKQIVWQASFTGLLNMYDFLYSKNYEDGDLKLIISILNDLLTYLSEYKEFTGYKEIEKLIQKTEIPLTWEK